MACYQLCPPSRLHRPEHHSWTKSKHTNQLAQALFEYLCHRVIKFLLTEPQAACLSRIAIGSITLSAARADVTVAADFDKIARVSRSHTREEESAHALEFVRSAAKTVWQPIIRSGHRRADLHIPSAQTVRFALHNILTCIIHYIPARRPSRTVQKTTHLSSTPGAWLEWTSGHQCTSWGWGRLSRFGDEPKTHPLSLPRDFSASFSAPEFSPPTYLPPLTYLTSFCAHSIVKAQERLKREPPSSQFESTWSGSHHRQSSGALEVGATIAKA
jgi:hypothetical protein